jgi:ATP-dependent DNA helicase RecQ
LPQRWAPDQFSPTVLAEDIEEERRVFHVAITRCSSSLHDRRAGGRPVAFRRSSSKASRPSYAGASATCVTGRVPRPLPANSPVVAALKAWRHETRQSRRAVPAYIVLHDSTLAEIAAKAPRSLFELGRVKGMGPTKLSATVDDEPFCTVLWT